jgi:hypothetical protein
LSVGATLRALLLMGAMVAAPIAAKTPKEVYHLPAPLLLDPAPNYETPKGYEPAPRKGMVLHGYRYDALNGPDWDSIELAQAATACGDRLKLPASSLRPENPDQSVTHNFWLIYSPPEALYISQIVTLTEIKDCVASAEPRISLARLFFAGDKVTEVRLENGRWRSPNTLPLVDGYGYFGNEFFRPADLTKLRRRPRTNVSPPEQPLKIGEKVICFFGSGGMIYTQDCRLDVSGPWQGLLVRKRSFHTATVDEGMEVDYLDTDALIDAGLFEWDRAITLKK